MTDPLALPFLEAARAGSLVLQTCGACGATQLPPRLGCGSCGSSSLAWSKASGAATLVGFTVLHRAPDDAHRARVPYVYALVELAEGPRLISTVVDCDPAGLEAGAPLTVRFGHPDGGDQPWPVFALREGG